MRKASESSGVSQNWYTLRNVNHKTQYPPRIKPSARTSTLRCSFRTLIACSTNPIALGRSALESRERSIVQMARSHRENFSKDNALCSRLA